MWLPLPFYIAVLYLVDVNTNLPWLFHVDPWPSALVSGNSFRFYSNTNVDCRHQVNLTLLNSRLSSNGPLDLESVCSSSSVSSTTTVFLSSKPFDSTTVTVPKTTRTMTMTSLHIPGSEWTMSTEGGVGQPTSVDRSTVSAQTTMMMTTVEMNDQSTQHATPHSVGLFVWHFFAIIITSSS